MSEKQPKEIWVLNQCLGFMQENKAVTMVDATSVEDCITTYAFTKYISETHHNEIVEGLKAEIEQLKKNILLVTDSHTRLNNL